MITPPPFASPGRTARFVAENDTDILGGVGDFLGDEVDDAVIALGLGTTNRNFITDVKRNTVFGPVVLGAGTDDKDTTTACDFYLEAGVIFGCPEGKNASSHRTDGVGIITGGEIQGWLIITASPPEGEGRKGERQDECQQKEYGDFCWMHG